LRVYADRRPGTPGDAERRGYLMNTVFVVVCTPTLIPEAAAL